MLPADLRKSLMVILSFGIICAIALWQWPVILPSHVHVRQSDCFGKKCGTTLENPLAKERGRITALLDADDGATYRVGITPHTGVLTDQQLAQIKADLTVERVRIAKLLGLNISADVQAIPTTNVKKLKLVVSNVHVKPDSSHSIYYKNICLHNRKRIPNKTQYLLEHQDVSDINATLNTPRDRIALNMDIDKSKQAEWMMLQAFKAENRTKSLIQYGSLMNASREQTLKRILVWTDFYGDTDWIPRNMFRDCPISNCQISYNRSELSISDVIIFHCRDIKKQDLPRQRSARQQWLMLCREPAPYVALAEFNFMFNLTMTYHRASDYPGRPGMFTCRDTPLTDKEFTTKIDNVVTSKSKFVVARISNCDKKYTKRIQYIRELQKYIHVDFFGRCGDLRCNIMKTHDYLPSTDLCTNDVMKEYKFYLGFENSHTHDYITEKFWRPLAWWNSVPVVMGGLDDADYLATGAAGAYINTEMFNSPKDLAQYLIVLDKNISAYKDYFQWWRYYYAHDVPAGFNSLCNLCGDLNKPIRSQHYTYLDDWYREA